MQFVNMGESCLKMSDESKKPEDQDNSELVERPLDSTGEILKDDTIDQSTITPILQGQISGSIAAFYGPIPHPTILKGYEEVLPGSADRILSMTEKEGEHRRKIETELVKNDNIRSYLGQIAGFTIAIVGLGGSIYLGINDKVWASGIMSAGTLTGLVTVFVKGDKERRIQSEQDDQDK
ncbi:MAG: DUF2335 domain-containing protein [Microcystis sp. M137S2]|nr:DUF2335 domain-containing protein [Microcystis sp. M087S2]MCA2671776.1 DUF2335 domain-containing protein [Microcystis sp. M080S2]MCA2687233.1 DUF2335 domain-containing protein [Microcystis sp. M037S2]MCA2736270.1 DUF2335 domain-containing protein [Microcystis sp. M158S2]MCA2738754.1 DUF2335 domain-containing protein [Microcystis sp. M165S2]MCA2753635.1 DUF2335 domain-containing protein [Microcystis sp. M137S2]MCA2762181.1 DUF2335 domain-containing protein [Microcystis sp. M151S2]